MKGIYIVMFHRKLSKEYSTDEVNSIEKCEFVDKISNKHLLESTFILDVKNSKIYKARNNLVTYDSLYKYVSDRYPEKIEELSKLIGV